MNVSRAITGWYFVGVDLGQSRDFTAMAVLERAELTGMRVEVGCEGREQYGAWREGTHDDLVFAVVLACRAARKMYPNEPAGEEAYWRFREWRDCEREFRMRRWPRMDAD